MIRTWSFLALLLLSATVDAATLTSGDNFIVMVSANATAVAAGFPQRLQENANRYRNAIAREWLGDELPPGIGRTVIHVELTKTEDSGLTWAKDSRQRTLHNVYLKTTAERAVGTTLAHEMAHVVLATEFAHPGRLAPWVEEGVASQYDDPSRKATRNRILKWYTRSGNRPELLDIMERDAISTSDQEAYAVASSLTELLVARRDKQTFIRFAHEAQTLGWDRALKSHYDLRGIAELEKLWQQSLTKLR